MKYGIGDIVRIKLDAYKIDTPLSFLPSMKRYLEHTYKVIGTDDDIYYLLDTEDGCSWWWHENWLEPTGKEINIEEKDFDNMFR